MQKRKAITNMCNKIVSLYGEKTLRKDQIKVIDIFAYWQEKQKNA